eukprot:1724911-Pyramimonas_sp.AAC.1
MDVKIGSEPPQVGRMIVRLRPDVVPRTCKNVAELLCKGFQQGRGYAGSKFTRVVPGGVIQVHLLPVHMTPAPVTTVRVVHMTCLYY